MSGPGSVEVVLFDCDGVLVDSAAAVERAWRSWAEQRGIPFQALAGRLHGRRSEDLIEELFPELDAVTEAAAVEALQVEDPGVRAVPGASRLLRQLPAERVGVVTSGSPQLARARLRYAGLPKPAALISATDVDAGKPNPAGYRLGAARLGVPAAAAIAVEDAPAGVAAAGAAGMRVAALPTTHPRAELGAATWVLDRLDELAELIAGLDPASPLLAR